MSWFHSQRGLPRDAIRLTGGLLAAIALLSAVAPLATDMYLPAFPHVATELGTSAAHVQLTLTGFMVGMAVGQLFWGPISDKFGRRNPLIVGGLVLVVASLAAPFSPNVELLIAARVLQGFAGSSGPVIGRALARDLSSGVALARAMSLLAVIGGLAPAIAPVLGGLLVEPLGWRGILIVVAVFAVAIAATSLFAIPETLPDVARTTGGLRGVTSSIRAVLTDRRFVGLTLTQSLSFGAMFAFISGSSFVIQTEYGRDAHTYSLIFAANALVSMAGGVLNGKLVGRVGPERMLRAGLTILTASSLSAATVTAAMGQPPLALLMAFVMTNSVTMASSMANTTTLGLQRHGRNAGMAAAVLGAVQSGFSGLVSPLVTVTGEASARSMTIVMAVCALGAVAAYLLLARPVGRASADH